MLRLKSLVTTCALTLAVSFGLSVAWPSYSSAASVYTFTFDESLNQNASVSGSFSIPVADFAGDPSSVSTSDITSLNMQLNSQSFGLSDVLKPFNFYFNYSSSVPQVYYVSGAFLVSTPSGCNPFYTTCSYGLQPGNVGLVDWVIGGTTSQVAGTWVTTETPLPSTWTMMLIGIAGLGFFAYRGTKKNTAALAAA